MKKSKSLLLSAPVLAGVLSIGLSPTFAQSSHTPADPVKTSTAPGSEVRATSGTPAPTTGKLGFSDRRFVTKTAEGGQLEIALADLASQRATNPEVRNFAQQLVSDHTTMARRLWVLAQAKGLSEEIAQYSAREGAIALASGTEPSSTTARVAVSPPRNQPGQTNYDETQKQPRATSGSVAATPPITSDVSTGSKASRDLANADAIDRTRANPDSGIAGAPTGPDIPADTKSSWNDPTKDRAYKRLADKSGAEFDQAFITAMVNDHEKEVEQFEKRAKDASDTDVKEFAAANLSTLREHLEKARSLSSKVTTP